MSTAMTTAKKAVRAVNINYIQVLWCQAENNRQTHLFRLSDYSISTNRQNNIQLKLQNKIK